MVLPCEHLFALKMCITSLSLLQNRFTGTLKTSQVNIRENMFWPSVLVGYGEAQL